jgi:hypothetical protein
MLAVERFDELAQSWAELESFAGAHSSFVYFYV